MNDAPVNDAPVTRLGPLEKLFIAALALFGFRLGARPISDNSTFAHLRTGIDMAAGRGIPRVDPYSFTARGHGWVDQSWLVQWLYGVAYHHGGVRVVVLEQAVVIAVLGALVAYLARAGATLRTAAAAVIAVGCGVAYWSPRPLLFGLLWFGLTVLVVEQRRPAWWLIPIVWFWANTHGSFPLGAAYLGAVLVGEAIDTKRLPIAELRYLGAFVVGLVVAMANPLGPRLLLFPLKLEAKKSVFQGIIEWRSPNFQRATDLFTLVFVCLALLVLIRRGVPWRYTLPVVGFLTLGLLAERNLAPAAVVLAPAIGLALRKPDSSRSADNGPPPAATSLDRVAGAGIALLFVLFAVGVMTGPALAFGRYPVRATDWLVSKGLTSPPHRMAEQDIVGDYLILRFGTHANVFIDDRADMYPVKVSDDFDTLLAGKTASFGVLDCYGIDLVLWDRAQPLVSLLPIHPEWHQVYGDSKWVVFERPPVAPTCSS